MNALWSLDSKRSAHSSYFSVLLGVAHGKAMDLGEYPMKGSMNLTRGVDSGLFYGHRGWLARMMIIIIIIHSVP